MRKWKQGMVDICLIDEAEINANKMTDEEFEKLKSNIRLSGGLSSAISCYKKEDGRFVIFSGHHRYRACVQLRYKEIPVIYADEKDMTKDEILALQLSHNSLHGEDNKGILKRLFSEIQDVKFKVFAHIDINEIQSIDVSTSSFSLESEHYSVCVVLYKSSMDKLDELLEIVDEQKTRNDVVLLADGEKNEQFFLELMKSIRNKCEIRSPNIQFSKILELAHKQLEMEVAHD